MWKKAAKIISLAFLTILFCSCNSSTKIAKAEYIKQNIPAELLKIEKYEHPKINEDKEIIAAYVNLWYFYVDLKTKIEAIKSLVENEND